MLVDGWAFEPASRRCFSSPGSSQRSRPIPYPLSTRSLRSSKPAASSVTDPRKPRVAWTSVSRRRSRVGARTDRSFGLMTSRTVCSGNASARMRCRRSIRYPSLRKAGSSDGL